MEYVLIDTSAWILALRPDGSPEAREEVRRLLESSRAATAGIVMLELLSGTRSQREFRELREELGALRLLDITSATWERAYRLGYDLRRAGLTIPSVDVLIAALALEHECSLLHADRHFDLIAEHHPLSVRSLLG